MCTRAFWMLTLAISLQTFASGAINLHQIPYMVDEGISQSRAALVLSLYAVFAGFGGLIQSFIEERFKLTSRLIFALGLLGSAVGVVILIFTHTFAMGVVFAAFYGTAFGLLGTSQQVVFAEYFGRESLGAIRGASLPFFMLLQALGPIDAGAFFDTTGSYIGAFVLFAFGYLFAAGAIGLATRPRPPSEVPQPVVAIG
jgi:MFS family permease